MTPHPSPCARRAPPDPDETPETPETPETEEGAVAPVDDESDAHTVIPRSHGSASTFSMAGQDDDHDASTRSGHGGNSSPLRPPSVVHVTRAVLRGRAPGPGGGEAASEDGGDDDDRKFSIRGFFGGGPEEPFDAGDEGGRRPAPRRAPAPPRPPSPRGLGASDHGVSTQMLLDANARLMAENMQLRAAEERAREGRRVDRETIETLRSEMERMKLRLATPKDCKLDDSCAQTEAMTLSLRSSDGYAKLASSQTSTEHYPSKDAPSLDWSSQHSLKDAAPAGHSLHSIAEAGRRPGAPKETVETLQQEKKQGDDTSPTCSGDSLHWSSLHSIQERDHKWSAEDKDSKATLPARSRPKDFALDASCAPTEALTLSLMSSEPHLDWSTQHSLKDAVLTGNSLHSIQEAGGRPGKPKDFALDTMCALTEALALSLQSSDNYAKSGMSQTSSEHHISAHRSKEGPFLGWSSQHSLKDGGPFLGWSSQHSLKDGAPVGNSLHSIQEAGRRQSDKEIIETLHRENKLLQQRLGTSEHTAQTCPAYGAGERDLAGDLAGLHIDASRHSHHTITQGMTGATTVQFDPRVDVEVEPESTRARANSYCLSGLRLSDPEAEFEREGSPTTQRARTFCVSGFGYPDPEVDIAERAVTCGGASATATRRRPRLLALCGGRSNDAATLRQLKNLRITDARYDIRCVHGPIPEEEENCPHSGLFRGPFWSWLDDTSAESLNESLVNGVRLVLKVVAAHGPFDGVYGFCHGAIVATLAANVAADHKLRFVVSADATSTSRHIKRRLVPDGRVLKDARKGSGGEERAERTSRRASTGAVLSVRRTSVGGGGGLRNRLLGGRLSTVASRPVEVTGAPFAYVICACAGVSVAAGLGAITCSTLGGKDRASREGSRQVDVPSLHLIGMDDPVSWTSEEVANLFVDGQVIDLPGGHAVGAEVASDDEFIAVVRDFSRRRAATTMALATTVPPTLRQSDMW